MVHIFCKCRFVIQLRIELPTASPIVLPIVLTIVLPITLPNIRYIYIKIVDKYPKHQKLLEAPPCLMAHFSMNSFLIERPNAFGASVGNGFRVMFNTLCVVCSSWRY